MAADAAREIGSLPVANVQALAETCNNGGDVQVPERYLAKDPSAEEVVAADDSSQAILVIDLQKLLDPQSSEECAKLGSACLNWGFFQIMSNGKFTSVEHRAVIHPTKERMSLALFFHPFPNMMVAPLPEFMKGDNERYRSTSYEDFMKQYFATKLDGRKHLERLKLELI